MTDRLEDIFDMQHKINCRCGVDLLHMCESERREWFHNYAKALQHEICEACDSIKWKWWSCNLSVDEAFEYILGLGFTGLVRLIESPNTSGQAGIWEIEAPSKDWLAMLARIWSAYDNQHWHELTRIGCNMYRLRVFYDDCHALPHVKPSADEFRACLEKCRTKHFVRAMFDALAHRDIDCGGDHTIHLPVLGDHNVLLRDHLEDSYGLRCHLGPHGISLDPEQTAAFDDKIGFMHPAKCPTYKMYGEADWQNVKVEIADMMHFFVSMALAAGMDANELYNVYKAKNRVNFQRQDRGYNTDLKTEDDNRSIEI